MLLTDPDVPIKEEPVDTVKRLVSQPEQVDDACPEDEIDCDWIDGVRILSSFRPFGSP